MRPSLMNTNTSFAAPILLVALIISSISDTGDAFSTTPFGMAPTPTPTPTPTQTLTSVTVVTTNESLRQRQRQRQRQQLGSRLSSRLSSSPLNMQQPGPGPGPGRKEENKNALSFSLSAYTSELIDCETTTISTTRSSSSSSSSSSTSSRISSEPSLLESFILPVSMASLMVTGNTVGAGMLVLPEVVAGPGPMLSFGVMIGAWMMCLTSGLTIAQVAIQEHESNGSDVPSSFKEFAEATLPSAANMVSGASVFINTLVVAFDVFKAGQIGVTLLPPVPGSIHIDGMFLSYIYSGLLVCLVSTQSLKNLSQVASMLVVGLFATFAGLLLPGLANVPDPMSVLSLPPLLPNEQLGDGLLLMIPVVISVLVFQNIVPTITRLLDYDRLKVGTALVCGSLIPLLMYIAWTVTVLGGGGLALGGLMTCFSLITVAGSSLGGCMSLSEEFEILLGDSASDSATRSAPKEKNKDIDIDTDTTTFSLPSVAMPIGMALVLAQIFSSDITETLKIAGAFGSPILYGFIPVSMALMQQRKVNKNGSFGSPTAMTMTSSSSSSSSQVQNSNIIPGGVFGLGVLALGSTALVGTELVQALGRNGGWSM